MANAERHGSRYDGVVPVRRANDTAVRRVARWCVDGVQEWHTRSDATTQTRTRAVARRSGVAVAHMSVDVGQERRRHDMGPGSGGAGQELRCHDIGPDCDGTRIVGVAVGSRREEREEG